MNIRGQMISCLLGIICLLDPQPCFADADIKCAIEVDEVLLFGQKIPLNVWIRNDGDESATVDVSRLKYIIRCLKPSKNSGSTELYSSVYERSHDEKKDKTLLTLRQGEGFFLQHKVTVPESGLYEVFVNFVDAKGKIVKKEKRIQIKEGKEAVEHAFQILRSKADVFDRAYALRCIHVMADEKVNRDLLKQLSVESEQMLEIALCEVLLDRLFPNEIHNPVRYGVNEAPKLYEARANQWVKDAKDKISKVIK
jgi:hypothetical protein